MFRVRRHRGVRVVTACPYPRRSNRLLSGPLIFRDRPYSRYASLSRRLDSADNNALFVTLCGRRRALNIYFFLGGGHDPENRFNTF